MPSAEWSFNGRVDLPFFMKLYWYRHTPTNMVWESLGMRLLCWWLTWTSWGINGYSCVGSKNNAGGYTKDYQTSVHLQHYKRDQHACKSRARAVLPFILTVDSAVHLKADFFAIQTPLYTYNYTRVSQRSIHPWKSVHPLPLISPISWIKSQI